MRLLSCHTPAFLGCALGLQGSAATLAGLAQSNLLVVPLDRQGQWYRYHHLFRDLLLAELDRLEPGLVAVLRRRAAQWHEGNGRPDEALEYWMQAGDADSVARLATLLTFPQHRQVTGRLDLPQAGGLQP
jgi:LuxR family transcriptional regulator, maltose regulon positive regulatory protein